MKRSTNIPVPLNEKFFKTVPMVDAAGNPIPQDQPLKKDGFWDKPETMADALKKKYRKGLK